MRVTDEVLVNRVAALAARADELAERFAAVEAGTSVSVARQHDLLLRLTVCAIRVAEGLVGEEESG